MGFTFDAMGDGVSIATRRRLRRVQFLFIVQLCTENNCNKAPMVALLQVPRQLAVVRGQN